jgi:hypothetical protein
MESPVVKRANGLVCWSSSEQLMPSRLTVRGQVRNKMVLIHLQKFRKVIFLAHQEIGLTCGRSRCAVSASKALMIFAFHFPWNDALDIIDLFSWALTFCQE